MLQYTGLPVQAQVQAAGVHRDRAGFGSRLRQLVDDSDADAAAREFAGGDQADGSGTDDDDVWVWGGDGPPAVPWSPARCSTPLHS